MYTNVIIILFVIAMVLAFLEIITPTFGLLALAGIGCAAAAVVLGFLQSVWLGWILLACVLFLGPIYLNVLVKMLPKTPLGKHLFLGGKPDSTPGQATPEATQYDEFVGKMAVADTSLHPAGMIKVEGQRIPANSQQGIIEKGTEVKIIKADAMNVVVVKA